MMNHETELLRVIRHNRWALGYISIILTIALLLGIFNRL